MIKECFGAFLPGTTLQTCGLAGCEAMAKIWSEANYPARSLIVSEDDTDNDVFFLLSGRARAVTYTDKGKEVFLSELPPGECIGFFAAIDGEPRSTNVVAIEDCRVARMSARAFNGVLDTRTDVMRAILSYLVMRVRLLSSRMTDVTTLNAEQRLISELLRLSDDGDDGESGVIDPLPTQQELATLIFSQRESVGREMSKLKDAGLIDRRGRVLRISSRSALRSRMERAGMR
ncbi:MAG: Crp/Fnr family transcriptional regulator [Pseudomonadota bacterium]